MMKKTDVHFNRVNVVETEKKLDEEKTMKNELKEWKELYEMTHGVSPWLTEAEYDNMSMGDKIKYDERKDYYYEFGCGELMSVRVHYAYESDYCGDDIYGYRAYPVTVVVGDCEGLYFAGCDIESGLYDWFEGGEPDDFAEFLVEVAETEKVKAMKEELWEYSVYSSIDMPRWEKICREIDYAVTMYAVDLYLENC